MMKTTKIEESVAMLSDRFNNVIPFLSSSSLSLPWPTTSINEIIEMLNKFCDQTNKITEGEFDNATLNCPPAPICGKSFNSIDLYCDEIIED
jgi:hypothetical protein